MRYNLKPEISSVNFAYFVPDQTPERGLFVVMETDRKTFAAVVFGNRGLAWKEHGKRYFDLWYKGEIGDQELKSQAEAIQISTDLGLDLDEAHAQLSQAFEKNFGEKANIVDPSPALDARIKAAHGS